MPSPHAMRYTTHPLLPSNPELLRNKAPDRRRAELIPPAAAPAAGRNALLSVLKAERTPEKFLEPH